MVNTKLRRPWRFVGVFAVALVALAACGSSGSSKAATPDSTGSTVPVAKVTPAWQKVIDAAKKEGSVTIYSSQGTDQLNDLAERFKKKYGIKVDILRDVDATIEAKVGAEHTANKPVADLVAISDASWINDKGAAGWWTKPTGPDFDAAAYDKADNINEHGSFVTSAAVFAIGWNTQQVPEGIKSYKDLLNPKFKGKIGINDATVSPSVVDFYFYLQEQNGNDFVQKLAALNPQVFPSVLQIGQNVTSGQLSVGLAVQALVDEKANGAPVDFLVPKPAWGVRFWTQITANAPHPNAAQLLGDFMVTTGGQEAIARKSGSALPDVAGAVISVKDVRKPDPSKLTPDAVSAFDAEFKKLFQ